MCSGANSTEKFLKEVVIKEVFNKNLEKKKEEGEELGKKIKETVKKFTELFK